MELKNQDMTEWKVGKMIYMYVCVKIAGDFSGGPVVKIPYFHCRSAGSIPGLEPKISH